MRFHPKQKLLFAYSTQVRYHKIEHQFSEKYYNSKFQKSISIYTRFV